jgi:hypothetical protein
MDKVTRTTPDPIRFDRYDGTRFNHRGPLKPVTVTFTQTDILSWTCDTCSEVLSSAEYLQPHTMAHRPTRRS